MDNEKTAPVWLPDWRDVSAYTDHGNDLLSWAWEFLRRNPEYQADYASWAALPDSEVDENGVSGWTPKYYRTYGDWESMIYFQPTSGHPVRKGETVGEYEARTGQGVQLLHIHLLEKWGLEHELPDPAAELATEGREKLPPYFPQYVEPPPGESERPRLLSIPWDQEDDSFMETFSIDIRLNLEAQLNAIEETVRGMKNDRKRGLFPVEDIRRASIHTDGMLQDLRIWDARLSKAEYAEIMDQLWGEEIKKAKKWTKADKNDAEGTFQKKLTQRITDSLSRTKKNIGNDFRSMLKWSNLPKDKPRAAKKKPDKG